MNWEINRHNWSLLRAEGGAIGVPTAICALEKATTEDEALNAYWRIDSTVVVQGAVHQAALATVSCLLQALPCCTDIARPHILELLVQIGSGTPAPSELEADEADLIGQCLHELVLGFPLYVSILERSSHPDEQALCIDLLGLSCRANGKLRERAQWYFQSLLSEGANMSLQRLIYSWLEEIGAPS